MEEEDMEDVTLDEKVVGVKDEMKVNATEKGEVKTKEVDMNTKVTDTKTKVMEAEKVENGNEDQVLAALGNIGRWQVQIIMITGQDIWTKWIVIGLEMRLKDIDHFIDQ